MYLLLSNLGLSNRPTWSEAYLVIDLLDHPKYYSSAKKQRQERQKLTSKEFYVLTAYDWLGQGELQCNKFRIVIFQGSILTHK